MWLYPQTYPQVDKLISFCSLQPTRTYVERTPILSEGTVMWIKDAAAGAGLVLFMVSAFMLASGAHVVLGAALSHLPI